MRDNVEYIHLQSGRTVCISSGVYDRYFSNFTEYQYYYFNTLIDSGLFFPQIMQFVFVLLGIFNGRTSFVEVFVGNLLAGVAWTIAWHLLKLYKILPGVCSLSCFIGNTFFRFKLNFVAIAIVSLFVIGDWKIILYFLVGSIVASIIRPLLTGALASVSYNDSAVIYASHFKS